MALGWPVKARDAGRGTDPDAPVCTRDSGHRRRESLNARLILQSLFLLVCLFEVQSRSACAVLSSILYNDCIKVSTTGNPELLPKFEVLERYVSVSTADSRPHPSHFGSMHGVS